MGLGRRTRRAPRSTTRRHRTVTLYAGFTEEDGRRRACATTLGPGAAHDTQLLHARRVMHNARTRQAMFNEADGHARVWGRWRV